MASFAQLGGLDMEPAVLFYSSFLAILTPWVSFLLGKAACRREELSIFFAFLITSAQGMVGFTDWTLSTRGTFYVFTPLAIALFIKATMASGRPRPIWLALGLVLGVMTFIHALWMLLVPSLTAAWLIFRLARAEDSLLRRRYGFSSSSRAVLVSAAVVCIVLSAFMEFGPGQLRTASGLPQILGGGIPSNVVTNLGLQYATVVGLGVALLPLGLYGVLKRPESRQRYALVGLSVVFLPVSLDPIYGIALALPLLLLVSTFSLTLSKTRKQERTSRPPAVIVGIGLTVAILTIAIPAMVTIPRSATLTCHQSYALDDQTYNAGMYIKYVGEGNFTFVWDNGIEASRIEAISGVPSVEPLESIGTLEYPWLRHKTNVQLTADPNPIESLVNDQRLIAAREWLPAIGGYSDYYWSKHTFVLLQNSPDSPVAAQIMQYYQSRYAIERCPGAQTPFFSSLNSTNYVIYADELQRTFSL